MCSCWSKYLKGGICVKVYGSVDWGVGYGVGRGVDKFVKGVDDEVGERY